MKLIIGLGNPGAQYAQTRHNAGFRVIDELASKFGWKWERRNRAMVANGSIDGEKVVLAKPITYMNLSGEAVGELVRWFKIEPEDILVVYDEMDLPLGILRLRANGSAAGHNGVKSIIAHLHSDNFPRLRIGVGHPNHPRAETIDHVLSRPSADENILLANSEARAVDAIALIVREGLEASMNHINFDPEAQRKAEERRRMQLERREQERLRRLAEQQAQQ